ncbi:MAG: S1C family serine protease [Planctomycetota bacterium]
MNPRIQLIQKRAAVVCTRNSNCHFYYFKACVLIFPWILISTWFLMPDDAIAQDPIGNLHSIVAPKVVKIVGTGGFRGLEAYQTGIFISDQGHVLTSWSYVLDRDPVKVQTDQGRQLAGKLMGYDPKFEIAILQTNADVSTFFELNDTATAVTGQTIFALSNLFGIATGNESVSIQKGVVSTRTQLNAKRGVFRNQYRGMAYFLDAITSNPGANGGAVVNRNGQLVGIIGKELQDNNSGTWINFAIPIEDLKESIQKILEGQIRVQMASGKPRPSEPITTRLLGILMVPDIVARTPPFIDGIVKGSAAAKAGLKPDDLILEVNGILTPGLSELNETLKSIDRDEKIRLTIQRGSQFQSILIGMYQ